MYNLSFIYYTKRTNIFTFLMDATSLHIFCILWISLLPVRIVSDVRTRRIPVDFSMSRQAAISAQVMPPITQITTIFGDNAPRWPFTTQFDKFVRSSKLRGSFSWFDTMFSICAYNTLNDIALISYHNYRLIYNVKKMKYELLRVYRRC